MLRSIEVKRLLIALLYSPLIVAYNVISTSISTLPSTLSASYDCRINSLWTSGRHPENYPANATFDIPIIVSHGTAYEMFRLNALASSSLKVYVETGVTNNLELDIITMYDKSDAIKDVKKGVDMVLSELTTFRLNGLTVDESRPYISAITRLSPSPDWFTGFNAFNAQQDGFWFNHFVVETLALDAGTSSGSTHSDATIPDSPAPQAIQTISNQMFGTLPVARWRCVLTTPQFDSQKIVTSSAPQQNSVPPAPATEITAATIVTPPSAAPSKGSEFLSASTQSDVPFDMLSDVPSDLPSDSPSSGTLNIPSDMTLVDNDTDTNDISSAVLRAGCSFGLLSVTLFLLF